MKLMTALAVRMPSVLAHRVTVSRNVFLLKLAMYRSVSTGRGRVAILLKVFLYMQSGVRSNRIVAYGNRA